MDVKNLLIKFLDFCNGGDWEITGKVGDVIALPKIGYDHVAREECVRLLELCGNYEMLDGLINMRGLKYSLFSYPFSFESAIMVPDVEENMDFPYAIMALARTTDIGGVCLLTRVSRCEFCRKFFLRPTSREAKCCSLECRNRQSNEQRKESGWFKQYYLSRKNE